MSGPLRGLRVVELHLGASKLGSGMSVGMIGMILGDQGADRVRIVDAALTELDVGIEYDRVWGRGAHTRIAPPPNEIRDLLDGADIALVAGPRSSTESAGIGEFDARARNPRLVWCRVAPSRRGPADRNDDYDLLVQAEIGILDQLPGNRSGPVFCDFPSAGYGAALIGATGVLALLVRRERTGVGGSVATSLYDGAAAMISSLIGRAETPSAALERGWDEGFLPKWVFECKDHELIQVVPGGKGVYNEFLALMGDTETRTSMIDELRSGEAADRERRWSAAFRTNNRSSWLTALRRARVPAEPILGIGEALSEPHLRQTGHSIVQADRDYGEILAVGPMCTVSTPQPPPAQADDPGTFPVAGAPGPTIAASAPPLEGIRVLDFGAFLAGPLGGKVLSDLGADVVEVEPTSGDPLRAVPQVYMLAHRGKRSLALDLKTAAARRALPALLARADIVLSNSRPGVAERLGFSRDVALAANPRVVHCSAPAYGSSGPWAGHGGFDQCIEAVTGIQAAIGGETMPPVYMPWSPVDIAGAWMGAASALLGYFAHLRTGQPQFVESTLLAAGLYAKSGVFVRGSSRHTGPRVDADATGYGPGYRLLPTRDGHWLAVVIAGQAAWDRLRAAAPDATLPAGFRPLRIDDGPRNGTLDALLGEVFRQRDCRYWLDALSEAELPHARVLVGGRRTLSAAYLDDTENVELGRVANAREQTLGLVEQPGQLFRSRDLTLKAGQSTPLLGEHSTEVLLEIGISRSQIDNWLAAGSIRATTRASSPGNTRVAAAKTGSAQGGGDRNA